MHNNSSISNHDLKTLLNIKGDLVIIDSYTFDGNNFLVNVSRERYKHKCPKCSELTHDIHDYYTRTIKHGIFNNYKCFIKYRQRRYKCSCGKKFNEDNIFVEKHNKISKNTKQSIFEESKLKCSFKDIAYRLNISSTTVIRHFLKHVIQPRRTLPEVLSIDEFKGNSGGNKYLVSLVDPINKTIIDIVSCRHKEHLDRYFSKFSKEELSNVKILTTDMWETYKDITLKYMPNATVVADTFHFVRHIYWAFNKTRVRIMKKHKKNTKEYKYLKRYWKLLVKKSKDISNEYYFDKRLKEWNSTQSIIDFCRNINPELNKAYELKESFYGIVDIAKYPTVYKKLNSWVIEAKISLLGEFREAANTIENWLPEIVNSFMIDPTTNKKYSNGFIEGTNNYIKSIKRISYGIKTFDLFRNKIMYQHKNSEHILIA
ncbi:ISL3 family transposase [Mycoplasmatota bacterium WC44]